MGVDDTMSECKGKGDEGLRESASEFALVLYRAGVANYSLWEDCVLAVVVRYSDWLDT